LGRSGNGLGDRGGAFGIFAAAAMTTPAPATPALGRRFAVLFSRLMLLLIVCRGEGGFGWGTLRVTR